MHSSVGVNISSEEESNYSSYKKTTDEEDAGDNNMFYQQSSQGQQPQQQQETGLTMNQILQYLAQHTMAIEQLLSRGQSQGEAAKPPLFNGEREKVVGFINACHLYISMRMKGSEEVEKILWVLMYIQGEVAEV